MRDFAKRNSHPLALLTVFLTGLLLCYSSLYGERQDAVRRARDAKVMEARLETKRMERDARRWREWDESVARQWAALGGSPKESEARIAAILDDPEGWK